MWQLRVWVIQSRCVLISKCDISSPPEMMQVFNFGNHIWYFVVHSNMAINNILNYISDTLTLEQELACLGHIVHISSV